MLKSASASAASGSSAPAVDSTVSGRPERSGEAWAATGAGSLSTAGAGATRLYQRVHNHTSTTATNATMASTMRARRRSDALSELAWGCTVAAAEPSMPPAPPVEAGASSAATLAAEAWASAAVSVSATAACATDGSASVALSMPDSADSSTYANCCASIGEAFTRLPPSAREGAGSSNGGAILRNGLPGLKCARCSKAFSAASGMVTRPPPPVTGACSGAVSTRRPPLGAGVCDDPRRSRNARIWRLTSARARA